MKDLFFEFIRLSIGTGQELSRHPSDDEWKILYSMSVKQSLIGICFAGVRKYVDIAKSNKEDIVFPEKLYYRWLGLAASIWQRNELLNMRCVELQDLIQQAGFRSFIMKGQGNAIMYGDLASYRQSGDIDIFLDGGSERIIDFVNKNYPTREINELELHYHCFNDVDVEIHFRPFTMDAPKDRILQSFFDCHVDECFKNKNKLGFFVPSAKFNIVHQLVHIHHHLFYEGVGLRQLMDYYYLLKSVDTKKINVGIIKNLGLNRFTSALMWVLEHVFGLEQEKMLCAPCETDGRFLLKEIMLSGNFGKLDERQKTLYNSKWNSFWIVYLKAFRLWRFDYWAWFWSPIYRIKSFLWRKINGYK